jgi:hypothetical protein
VAQQPEVLADKRRGSTDGRVCGLDFLAQSKKSRRWLRLVKAVIIRSMAATPELDEIHTALESHAT